MENLSLRTDVVVDDTNTLTVAYCLTHNSGLFGIECYVMGAEAIAEERTVSTYFHAARISPNERFVAQLIQKLAKRQVMPVHIGDIVDDLYPCS